MTDAQRIERLEATLSRLISIMRKGSGSDGPIITWMDHDELCAMLADVKEAE